MPKVKANSYNTVNVPINNKAEPNKQLATKPQHINVPDKMPKTKNEKINEAVAKQRMQTSKVNYSGNIDMQLDTNRNKANAPEGNTPMLAKVIIAGTEVEMEVFASLPTKPKKLKPKLKKPKKPNYLIPRNHPHTELLKVLHYGNKNKKVHSETEHEKWEVPYSISKDPKLTKKSSETVPHHTATFHHDYQHENSIYHHLEKHGFRPIDGYSSDRIKSYEHPLTGARVNIDDSKSLEPHTTIHTPKFKIKPGMKKMVEEHDAKALAEKYKPSGTVPHASFNGKEHHETWAGELDKTPTGIDREFRDYHQNPSYKYSIYNKGGDTFLKSHDPQVHSTFKNYLIDHHDVSGEKYRLDKDGNEI